MISFGHILQNSCTVAAGHVTLTVIPLASILGMTKDNGLTGHSINDITISPGAAWYQWSFAAQSTNYRESPKKSGAGKYYEWSLDLFIPFAQEYISRELNSWKDGKFILVLEDGMNTSKVLGTMQAPGRYDPEVIQEGRGAGKNGYNVSFKGRSRHENYFFTGSITLAPMAISVSFDGDGYLIADMTNDHTLSLSYDADGNLTMTGPNAHRYSFDTAGNLQFN